MRADQHAPLQPRTLPGPAGKLATRVDVPPSKSLTNRALVAAAVADGGTVLSPLDCDDTRLLARAISGCGWSVRWADAIEVGPRRAPSSTVAVDLGNSGTGARMALALTASVPGNFVVDGSARLRERPMEPLVSALEQIGARVSSHEGFLPAEVSGRHLAGGRLRLRPQVSSQFVTALLLVAPLMRDGLDLELVGPVPSQPYLDLTEDVLAEFGARVQRAESGRRWRVEPSSLAPTHFSVEGDWSAAAFFLAAAAVAGGTVDVGPLGRESRQGDRRVAEILARAGVEIDASDDRVRATGPATVPLRADLRHAPDLFPALAAVASVVPEGSILTGLDHLRHKESDRLSVMVENLRGLGVGLEVERSSFKVTRPVGRGAGSGARVAAAGDHRIAMAMAVTALAAGALELDDAACVSKSFPGFWECWEELVS